MSDKFQIISPVNNQVFAEKNFASEVEIDQTLAKSASAFESWKKTTIKERAELCTKVVDFFLQNADKWAKELTMLMGRPIRYTPFEIKNGFKERAEFMISEAEKALTDVEVSDKPGFKRFIRKEPLGTVLVLAPWNYPYLTSVNAIIPAIMAGNMVILKHATQTALCAENYQKAFDHAGFPEGVFQFLHLNHDQVAKVIGDPGIQHVCFTGSVEGGYAIQKALSKRFINAGLELGGKDPAYVCEDADLEDAVANIVDGVFFNSGQSCCGIERIYVHEKVYDEFVAEFVTLTKKYILGDPLEPETTLGPMVRVSSAENVFEQINQALKLGGQCLINENDFPDLILPYLAPQILVDVNHKMDLMTEETFGPVTGIMKVKNDEEAVQLMNDSKYGLTASIWTKDVEKAIRIGSLINTGTWFMNRCDYLDPELAWTGVKDSGKGCTLSVLGYDSMTRPKSFHLKLP